MTTLAILALILAAGPAVLVLRNLSVFPPLLQRTETTDVSILIPARDEERNIHAAVEAALQNPGTEILVLDDGSSDRTAEIVERIAARESRVRVLHGELLPQGWAGKNWACAQLARAASRPSLLYVDADVRLAPFAAASIARWMRDHDAQLVSGIPLQQLGSFLEWLLVPLIHFVLLGFLPLRRMRRSTAPAYGTACGQLLMVDAAAYQKCGGHTSISNRLHEGLALPKVFREAGFRTDLFDGTTLATCRMYRSSAETWRGFVKNAHEGLGAPARIVPATTILLIGQVLPFVLLAVSPWLSRLQLLCAAVAAAMVLSTRITLAARFRQPLATALLHPLAVLTSVAIQWIGLLRWLVGKPARWKAREYVSASASNRMPATHAGEHLPERV